jgi:hypothetical protein
MNRRRSAKRAALALIILLGAGGLAVHGAASPYSRRHRGHDDEVASALKAALHAYSYGDVQMALAWTGTATRLLEEETSKPSLTKQWPRGNANQLLDLLQTYSIYAGGSDPELDEAHDELVWALERIGRANTATRQPDEMGGLDLDYDLIHHVVTRLDDIRVDYDLITWQIRRIGEHNIDYDLIRRVPRRIGPIEFEYDLIRGGLRKVAGVELR